jgi:hypothetical protein
MKTIYIIAIAVITVTMMAIFAHQVESYVPPTGNFKIINTTGGNVTAQFTNDSVEFIAGDGLVISSDYASKEITFSTTNSITAREHLVADWMVDRIWVTIGTSYDDVYDITDSNGDGIRIDTNGMTTATINIMWTKIGTGIQTCQIVDITNATNVLITSGSLVSGENTLVAQAIPAGLLDNIKTYKIQCKSTVGLDAPIFLHGTVLLME